MDAGTHHGLHMAEGQGRSNASPAGRMVYSSADDPDEDSELRFGFASDAVVTEEMLAEMRRRNQAAAMEAMNMLRGGARLPTINRRQNPAKRRGDAKPRRRPGSIGARAETPTEVRQAAAREKDARERDMERGWMKNKAKANPGPHRRSSANRTGWAADAEEAKASEDTASSFSDPVDADRRAEAEVAMRILDFQAEGRYSDVPLKQLWNTRPQSLFDRELISAIAVVERHNDLLSGYVKRAEASDTLDTLQRRSGSKESGEGSQEQSAADMSAEEEIEGNSSRAKRRRKEIKLEKLVGEGKELRQKALHIVRRGGAAACRMAALAESEDQLNDSMQFADAHVSGIEVSDAGRRVMLLLHGMLIVQVDSDAFEAGLKEQAQTMKTLLARMHKTALREGGNAPVPVFRRSNSAAERRARKRERMWRNHVSMYSSLSGTSVDNSDEGGVHGRSGDVQEEKVEKYIQKTMSMLRSSGGWLGGPPPGSDEETLLEQRLSELQRTNQRLGEYSREEISPPTRMKRIMSGKSDEGRWMAAEERGRSRNRRIDKDAQIKRVYGARTSIMQWSPARGYTADLSGAESDFDRSQSPMVHSGAMHSSAVTRRRQMLEAKAMRRLQAVQGQSDAAWLDHVLPSATEMSEVTGDEEADGDSFFSSAVAQQVMKTMAAFKDSERAKQEEIVRREVALSKFEGRMKRMHNSVEHVSVVQDRIFREVHKIRRNVTTNVRGIFQRIGAARGKLQAAKLEADPDLSRLIQQEAQRELLEVEAEALDLRQRMRKSKSIKIDFMPAYLRDFLMKDDSAQAMFDQGRIRQMQAKAAADEAEENKRQRKMDDDDDADDGTDIIAPVLTPEEQELLGGCIEDAKQLNKVLRMSHVKNEEAAQLNDTDPLQAMEAANTSTRMMEQALIMSKHLRKKMRGRRAKHLKHHLPRYLKNIKNLGVTPLMDAWKTGLTEPGICEAVEGVERINRQVQMAKNILVKLDRAEALTDREADQAQELLEGAIVLSVEVRERGRAAMLDVNIGGAGVAFWRFPKHVQNLVATDESVIVLWEKGLIDEVICTWVKRVDEANATVKQSLKHEALATEFGESPEGLEELRKMDVLQYKADKIVEEVRQEIRRSMVRGLPLSRLPPHLQNLVKDERPYMMLFTEGKTDPVMAVMEYRAEIMLKNKQKSEAAHRRAKKLQDEENRKAALQAATDLNESTMKEMLKLRAKVMMGGINVEQLRGSIARVIEDAEDDMEDGEEGFQRAKTAMEELGAELGADEELMARIVKLSRKTGTRDPKFARIDWDSLVGKYAEELEPPDAPYMRACGFDVRPQPVAPFVENPMPFPTDPDVGWFAGLDTCRVPSFEMAQDEVEEGTAVGFTTVPVRDDPHKRYPEGQAPPFYEATEDEAHLGEYMVSGTEEEGDEVMPMRIQPKKYDSDDEIVVEKLERKKKKAETAKTRIQGKTRSGIPLEVRRTITKSIVEAKRTLKLDISRLQLPYIPKQVTDLGWLEVLICDHNLIDELEPPIGKMVMLRVLSLSWNRIESPLPAALYEMAQLRELRLDHNQLDVLEPDIVDLSNLTKLRLDDNNLTDLPGTLGKRTNLKFLSLDKNNLTDLPRKLAGMYGLQTLTMSRNLLTHIPTAVFALQRLKVLHVHYNQIPTFSDSLSNLKNLTDLNFAVNLLTEVRPVVSRLSALTKLDLQRNQIPVLGPEIGYLPELKDLTLSKNLLKVIPEEFEGLTAMVKLKLDSNELTYLPLNLTFLTKLEVLDLRNNKFIALAPQLGRLSRIKELRIDGNPLQTPPVNVCDLGTEVMLRYLDRNDVAIATDELDLMVLTVPKKRVMVEKGKGRHKDKYRTIPEIPCLLHDFHFPHGWWSGAGLLQRSNLTTLRLGGNGLRRLNGAELSGHRSFAVVPHGQVDGKAPVDGWELDPLTKLSTLTIENNHIVFLPDEFGMLTSLTMLDISENSIEDLNGREWGKLTNLTRLDLHGNARLTKLPVQFGRFDNLRWLSVVGCSIASPPPVIIQRGCRPIIDFLRHMLDAHTSHKLELDGMNLLTIPNDITRHSGLTVLNLRRNNLTRLDPDIGQLGALRILHLDDNKLSTLPDEIKKLTGLTSLTLRANYFQRLFPEDYMWLGFTHLNQLDISYNQLSELPALIGGLTRLSSLDASENRLKTLPFELHRLTNLTHLNLQNNVLRLPLVQLTEDLDIGVVLEFLRTLFNAAGSETLVSHVQGTLWLDLSFRQYRLIPPEATRIRMLTVLKLHNMLLEWVDPSVAGLSALVVLELHDNELHALPDELESLTTLTRLSLSRNWFARLPYCIPAMVSLKELHFDDNQLTVIPADIGKATSLTEMDFSRNCLRAITPALTCLNQLTCLDCSSNQITYVPVAMAQLTGLKRLSLRNNYITELPLELHVLSEGALTLFDINENGLKSPPPEVVAKGTEAMFDYMRRFHTAETSLVLDLSDLGLTYLPAEVMRFYQTRGIECIGLTSLILDGNDLSWLPVFLRNMTTLKKLSLRNCKFTELPYFLGDLRDLHTLDLLGNDISVPPDDIIRRGVYALLTYMRAVDSSWWTKELDLSGQRFEQVPLEVCNVDSLTSLRMHNQEFANIPDQIGRLTALTHLNLQHCALVEVPDSISGLYSLRELIINNNRLLTLPAGIGKCTALTELRAHENVLEDLPPEIGNLRMMLDLRLFNNNLLELPTEVGQMRYLPAFRISLNQLPKLTTGISGLESVSDLLIADNFLEEFPKEIGLLTSITRLRATNNRLTSLPNELGNLYNMTELAVSDNRIKELPHLGHLTALRNLTVANNPLTCPPDTVVRKGTFAMVNYLRVLHEAEGAPMATVLRGQDAVGAFHDLIKKGRDTGNMALRSRFLIDMPHQVLDIPSLTSLDVEGNVIERIPEGIGGLTNLTSMTVSYNQILDLPNTMRRLRLLETFEARYNQLKAFPEGLCTLRLKSLYLDSNELQDIPSYVSTLWWLEVLSVTNNNIRKLFDEGVRGLTSLRELRLQQNELILLPESFGCMTNLEVLNMSFNHLVSLPASTAELTRLKKLVVSYNDLDSKSLIFERMLGLQELHLTQNRLTGIPHTFASLSQLNVLAIGSNDFPVDAQYQYIKTNETAQKWLKINLESWQAAQGKAQKKAQGKRGLPG